MTSLMAWVMIGAGILAFSVLTFGRQKAWYGRYTDRKLGRGVPARAAWIIQESPVLIIGLWFLGTQDFSPINTVLAGLLLCHYIQRTMIYPFLIRGGKPTPIGVMLMAFIFCCYNGYLQMMTLSSAPYPDDWWYDLRFITGIIVFFLGMGINIQADHILRNIRKPGESGYKIPNGGGFEWVSGANFFGEILEWLGFAIACWNLPAFAFALFTFCNIGPRGYHHHLWYKQQFPDYPPHRKAVIPKVW